MGREDPIEFDIYPSFMLCLFISFELVKCFVAVTGGINFNSSLVLYIIYLYLFWSIYFDVCAGVRVLALARTRTPGTLLKHKPIQTIWYAATTPRLAYIQLWLNNSDFGKDIVTPWWWS